MIKEIKLQWVELFSDYKDFHNKHFISDGWNIYESFKKSLEGYHYTNLVVNGNVFVNTEGDMIKYDIFSCRIVGSEKLIYIRVDYDMSCSNEEIFDCYIVEEKEKTIKQWVRSSNEET